MTCAGSYQRAVRLSSVFAQTFHCRECAAIWERRELAGEHKANAPLHSPASNGRELRDALVSIIGG